MPRTFRLAAAALVLTVGPAAAQDPGRLSFEVWLARLSSEQPTLTHGGGGGVGVDIRLGGLEWLTVGIVASLIRNDSERDGSSCLGLSPYTVGCQPERLAESVSLRTLGVAVRPYRELIPGLRAAGGLGVSITEMRVTSRGVVTQRMGNLYATQSGHMGGLVDVGLAWSPVAHLPLELVVGGTSHWIIFDGCRTDPVLYSPYCGATRLQVWRLGLSWALEY
jgi:hypothetical protein